MTSHTTDLWDCVCVHHSVCGNVGVSPSVLCFSLMCEVLCVLILRFVAYICTCVYVSVHMHVTTPAWKHVKV